MTTKITSDTMLLDPDRHARVTAGPGAGKTQWLILHTDNVVRRSKKLHGHARIALITYTNVAADQLRKRLGTNAQRADVCTIHSFLYQNIIKPYVHLIKNADGQPLVDPQLLDGHDEHHVNHQKLKEWLTAINGLGSIADEGLFAVLKTMHWMQHDGSWEVRVRPGQWDNKPWKKTSNLLTPQNLYSYKTLYWADGIIDHEDVLYFASRIIAEHPTIASCLSARYPFVFIDEFQDTVPAQTSIVRTLAGNGSTIVIIGDAEQSIFAFAGAQREHFNEFALPKMDDYTIVNNRRSTKRIIELLNHVRGDGLAQEAFRDVQGEPPTFIVGSPQAAAQHAATLLGAEESLLVLARNETTVRHAQHDTAAGDPWNEIEQANPRRKILLEHLFAGLVLARAHRFSLANATVLRGIRHEKDLLKEPLSSKTPRPSLHRRAIAVVLLRALVRLGLQLDTMTLRQAYDHCNEALTQNFQGLTLTKIQNGKGFAIVAEKFACATLLESVKPKDTEEVRNTRTIHKAKGAEANNVLVCLHGKNGTQQRLDHIMHPKTPSDEEHRITYVGISRARDRLFLATQSLLPEEATALEALGLSVVHLATMTKASTPPPRRAARSRTTQRPLATTSD